MRNSLARIAKQVNKLKLVLIEPIDCWSAALLHPSVSQATFPTRKLSTCGASNSYGRPGASPAQPTSLLDYPLQEVGSRPGVAKRAPAL